jgi:GTP-binding protein
VSPKSSIYLGASPSPGEGPAHDLPEVAVAGRSNVGKSSLLNALLGARVARTSRTPGRTRLLHLFVLRRKTVLVDLPGLGYAKLPARMRAQLGDLVFGTVSGRSGLRGLLLLVDIRRKPGDQERALLDSATRRGLRVQVVATKADQLPRHKRKPAVEAIERWSGLGRHATSVVSVKSGDGVDALRELILSWAEAEEEA